MTRIRSLVQYWFPSHDGHHASPLHSPEVLQDILDRERMRCDRGNSSFALLTMAFPAWQADGVDAIARVLNGRIRATDDVGIIQPGRLGVVLPETDAAGAWTLADDLCQLLEQHTARPQCEVYTYPTQPTNGHPVSVETNGHAERNGTNGHATPAAVGGRVNGHRPRQPAQPMETFFVRPLPLWKRAIDVLGAGLALLLAAPLMLLVAAGVKLTSPGPIIFKQKRDTIGGRSFLVYKFRTMSLDAESRKAGLMALNEQDGPAFKIAKDPRITPLGRLLRVTSIDELPQLFNVLMGDMTLVGPRALPSNESRRCEPWQRRRLDVTAGITCVWQVRGRSSVSFSEWMRMDLSYIRSRSLASDLKLIAETVPAVLLRRGAY